MEAMHVLTSELVMAQVELGLGAAAGAEKKADGAKNPSELGDAREYVDDSHPQAESVAKMM